MMKMAFGSLLILVLAVCLAHCYAGIQEEKFEAWLHKQEKKYSSHTEYHYRLAVFRNNERMVTKHNKEGHSYELELNEFADMTFEEFSNYYLINKPQDCSATKGNHMLSGKMLPEAIDWRQRGVVSGVKNQGHCGSCWTFSTTGAMEAHFAMEYRRMLNLSEQQLIGCAQAFHNKGCEGGLPSQAFEYIRYAKGLQTEKTYPYKMKDGPCLFQPAKAVAFVSDVVNITQYGEDELADAVATKGPVSIAFQVAKDFHMYKKGVYSSMICQKDPMHVNHAVLAVGFNQTETGEKYWIVKNSWGPKWGMKGYFNIVRGQNMCGLADCASYPVVSDQP